MSDFEAGWIAAEMGKSFDPKKSWAWRNGWKAMYASVGL